VKVIDRWTAVEPATETEENHQPEKRHPIVAE
jgi:hypothetical protein